MSGDQALQVFRSHSKAMTSYAALLPGIKNTAPSWRHCLKGKCLLAVLFSFHTLTAYAEPPLVGNPIHIQVETSRPAISPPVISDPIHLVVEANRPEPQPPKISNPIHLVVEASRSESQPPQIGIPIRLVVEASRPAPQPPQIGNPIHVVVEASRPSSSPPEIGNPIHIVVEATRPSPPPPQISEPIHVAVITARPSDPASKKLDRAKAALKTCDINAIRAARDDLASIKTNSQEADMLVFNLEQEIKADDAITKSKKAAYEGDLDAADEHLKAANATTCGARKTDVTQQQDKTDQLRKTRDRADEILASCDQDAAEKLLSKLKKQADPSLLDTVASLDRVIMAVTALAKAQDAYLDGDLEAAESYLNDAAKSQCKDNNAMIAKGREKISRLRDILKQIKEAMTSCNLGSARSMLNKIKGTKHILLNEASASLDRIISAHMKSQSSKKAFFDGDLDSATNHLDSALAELNHFDSGACPNLRGKIKGRHQKITRLRTALGRADAAIRACQRPAMQTIMSKLSKHNHVLTRDKVAQLKTALRNCAAKQQKPTTHAEARRSCAARYGEGVTARRRSNGTFSCNCGKGYLKNSSGKGCISREKVVANGKRYCARQIERGILKQAKADGEYKCGCPSKLHYNKWRDICMTWKEVVAEGKQACGSKGQLLGHIKKYDDYICCPSGMPYYKKSNNTCYAKKPKTRSVRKPQEGPRKADKVIKDLTEIIKRRDRKRNSGGTTGPRTSGGSSGGSTLCKRLTQALQKNGNHSISLSRGYSGQKSSACALYRLSREQQNIIRKMKNARCQGTRSIPQMRIPHNPNCR